MSKKSITNSLSILASGIDLFLGNHNLPAIASPTVVGMATFIRVIKNAKEKSLNNKLKNFLRETQTTTDEERLNFIQRLDEDQEKFQERILLLIERLDDEQKATMIGRLCKAFILLHISKNEFFRLALIIEKIYHDDLDFFYTRFKNRITSADPNAKQELIEFEIHAESKPIINNLVNAGLIETEQTGLFQHGSPHTVVGHQPTAVGKALLHHGFLS